MKKLKTLEEHNAFANKFPMACGEPTPNGIACPKCGEELVDSNPIMVLTSNPPQKNISCRKEGCGYIGYRIL